ncbi:hypothetical protein ACP4OV_001411 [Aristida adscensionis]
MMYYAGYGRAREMEMAAAEGEMGCSCAPLGKMISRVIKGCNGRKGRARSNGKLDYAMAYAPAQACYVRPTARTVTFAGDGSHHHAHAHGRAMPPEPVRHHATMSGAPIAATAAAPPRGAGKPRKSKKKKRVRFTPEGPVPADAPPPHAGVYAPQHTVAAPSGSAVAASVYRHGAADPYSPAPPAAPGQGHGYGYAYGRYAPSPLPRWETAVGTPRRHEYFSGEYRWYYPTPVREGIYSIATDANRLTAIFSEENPNACTIV